MKSRNKEWTVQCGGNCGGKLRPRTMRERSNDDGERNDTERMRRKREGDPSPMPYTIIHILTVAYFLCILSF